MHALYDLAVGPLAWLAFGVFIIGSIYRLLAMRALALKKDGAFMTYISWPHAIKSLVHWFTPFGALGWKENPGVTIATFVFHICLFLVPIFLMGHIVLFDTFRGWSWPALPDGVADALAIVVVLICAYFLWRRLSVPEVRFLTTPQDVFVVSLVGLTFLTGVLAYHRIGDNLVLTTLHILCGEAMLAAIPFTRLSHMLFAVFSRGYIASEFGSVRFAKDW
ncbi:TmcC family electron transfer complex membrane anchor subunit [Solidesulfovibrio sp.]|jgi:nitrate reductase gamma subunit|uniref:TmcC family electron transfer complex membrane anchor subunit n=1 Tax=Solidesulfovibrio sp. TaxID=2910990 RepID=UPI000EBA2DD5|nr:nitrate reductase [Solidesulfovibrio sp.]MEA5088101.1 nitrate reductase [Solidesulfovibrio sp.]HCR13209.1 nitrate reductase [Desulfovibrio sp.]HML62020.1 nitrate reductase [Solidesulfovibrio sp.]